MATKVLTPPKVDSQTFHQPRPRRSSPPSSTSLYISTSPPRHCSSPRQSSFTHSAEHLERVDSPSPTTSSLESSPQSSMLNFSHNSSLNSTPLTGGLSFEGSIGTPDEDIDFPNYGDFSGLKKDDSASTKSGDDDVDTPGISASTDTTRSDSPLHTPTVADDTAIKQQPSQHVDYLSHDWREEDIWASWRHIVSQRKVYGQRSRLENASWRTWAKSKYHLRTISPETLNWLKESDVTWLYGPLKPAQTHPITSNASTPQSHLSKSSSFVKKPILKKRSVSEVMLQKSLSTSSLVKQAAASVQAQATKSPRRGLNRVNSELSYAVNAPSQPPSREEIDYFSIRTGSAVSETPSDTKEKHIRFDERVEQCVAIDCKDPAYGDFDDEIEDDPQNSSLSESSSDEGLLMMSKSKRTPTGRERPKGRLSRTNSSQGKMIETIEATTLKYRTDSPDVPEQPPQPAQHHTFGSGWGSGALSHSPSQETLRPSRPSRNFLLVEDEEEDADADNSASWSFGASNPKSSLGASVKDAPSSSRNDNNFVLSDGYEGMQGMRRTESGMFMPIDEDEDDLVAAGLFGRVSETVNTVKDIGWVLWNSFSQRRDS
ncbi:protein phosphatase regulator [Saxophila tyrrhenica]|uniref:Protein phosphatase regulator n=1 Tax=Saxophila tyrrhenica TaxID=1690608 RepID=A0AAV9PQ13_9PEZI|nr:protein phosphatase regulator [Saxophila tyrrhenica]